MSIEALIFDVDGTLADTEEAHRTAFNLAFERFRLGWVWGRDEYRELLKITGGKERITHYLRSLTTVGPAEFKRLLDLVPDLHAEKTRFYSKVVGDGGVPLREGVARLLDEALNDGCRLAIASTTTAMNVDALLQANLGSRGLEKFSVIACGDQVRSKKPAPDIYLLALKHLGLHAEQAVAFEDSYNGLRSAVSAGLRTIVTPTFWTEGSDFGAATLVLPTLGSPAHPLIGEPGGRLRNEGWLSFADVVQLTARPKLPSAVRALYQGTTS